MGGLRKGRLQHAFAKARVFESSCPACARSLHLRCGGTHYRALEIKNRHGRAHQARQFPPTFIVPHESVAQPGGLLVRGVNVEADLYVAHPVRHLNRSGLGKGGFPSV